MTSLSTAKLGRSALLIAGSALFWASASAAAEGGESSGSGRFVQVSGMEASIIDGANAAGKLTISFAIEARNLDHASDLAALLPTLRAAATGAVTQFATLHVSIWKPVNAGQLHSALNSALTKADPRVKAVHLTAVRAGP